MSEAVAPRRRRAEPLEPHAAAAMGSTRTAMIGLYRDDGAAAEVRARGAGRLPQGRDARASCISISARRPRRRACARICAASDWVTSTHRGHGHALAKGMDPRVLMAELYGKHDGCCGGRGGTMHLYDPADRPVRHERPRRRRHPLGRRRRDQREVPRHGRGRGGLLRRRRHQPRGLSRGSQFRRRAARPGGARLREQPLRHRDGAVGRHAQPGDRHPRRRLRHPRRRRRRQRRRRRLAGHAGRRSSEPGAARGRR